MLSSATECPKVYGFDESVDFLQAARRRFDHCIFVEHDVTKTPFPVRTQVMYVRFLLSHLTSVVDLVNLWLGELAINGKLFVDELEDIVTDIDVFQEYIKINSDLIASQGASLFIGKTLAGGKYEGEVLYNECVTIPVENQKAASWFFPNTVKIWKDDRYIIDNFSKTETEEISRDLLHIKESNDIREEITWKMRRIVLTRKGEEGN
jgi:hypothetical protein